MTEEAHKTAKAMHQNECEDCVFNPTKLGCRWRKKGMYCDTNPHSAADLIESLSAQNEELLQKMQQLEKQLEQVAKERDAAVNDIEDCLHAKGEDEPECKMCNMQKPACNWECEKAKWKRRGVEVTNDAKKGSDAKS